MISHFFKKIIKKKLIHRKPNGYSILLFENVVGNVADSGKLRKIFFEQYKNF